MAKAICKNTFISVVVDPVDCSDDTTSLQRQQLYRSRSAESIRCRAEEAEAFEVKPQQSLHRLNAVLSVGISSPLQILQKPNVEVANELELEQPAFKLEEANERSASLALSELRSLQGKLAKALSSGSTPHSSPPLKPWDKQLRVASTCSLSTMAPDDAEDLSLSNLGATRMKHVWSSGSVSTMISDVNESFAEEDGEVEFELDIEAGAVAALEATDARQPKTLEMSHSQVPRNQNMEEMFESTKDEPPTTMMIRNIPGRYSQNDLMLDLKDLGFAGTYDFLYMPMDKGTAANVGYAFVNFVNDSWAEKCMQSFTNYRFARHQRTSSKLASVSVAHLQGLEKNLQHYENAAVNMSKEKRRRPVVVANIAKMFG